MQYPLPPLDLRIEVGQPKDAGEKHWKIVCDHAAQSFRFLGRSPSKTLECPRRRMRLWKIGRKPRK